MTKTEVFGGFDSVSEAIDVILASGQPNIVQVIEVIKGKWIILHKA